jgi:ketosteroid isomerase-like protein
LFFFFLALSVDSIVQDRDNTDLTKVCIELEGTATLKSDKSEWKNYYSWVMHFRKEQAIVVRAYVDSAAVNHAMS